LFDIISLGRSIGGITLKNRVLAKILVFSLLIVAIAVTPIVSAEVNDNQETQSTAFWEPLMLEPTYNILTDYRITIYEAQHTDGKGRTYQPVLHPLSFYLGNGLCIDGNGNIYLDVLKLLKVDNSRDYILKKIYKDQSIILITKIGSEMTLYGGKATINSDSVTCTHGKLVQTFTKTETGFEHNSNMPFIFRNSKIEKIGNSVVCRSLMHKVEASINGDVVKFKDYTIKKVDNSFILTGPSFFGRCVRRLGFRSPNRTFKFEGNVMKCIEGDNERCLILEDGRLIDKDSTYEIEYTD
jgi:hypothetical protein